MNRKQIIDKYLSISRPDIAWDHIQQYPVQERFFPLPVDKYLDMASVIPIESQVAIINALNSPQYRFVTCCLSRRQGKTFIANHLAFLVALIPDTKVLIISPSYDLSSISWNEQHSLVKQFDIKLERDNAKERSMVFPNGSEIRLASVTRADSAVGRSYDLILFDEASLSDLGKDAFNVALRPTLDKPKSKCIFISTPRGSNWFKEFYERGYSDQYPRWCSIHAPYQANPRISEEDIAEARIAMSRGEFSQEYMADFGVYEGQIFELKEHCIQDLSGRDWNPYEYETLFGVDFGFRDQTTCVCLKYSEEQDKFFVVEEYSENEKTTSQHAAAIKSLETKWDAEVIYCDSASPQTMWDFAQDYDLSTHPAKKSVLDGINYLQNLFEQDRIIVDESCTGLIWSLDQYAWDLDSVKPRPNPKGNSKKASHLVDALRYGIYTFTN